MKFSFTQHQYTLNELYEVIHEAGGRVIESNIITELPTPTYADGPWLPKQNSKPQPATFLVIVEVPQTLALYRIKGNFAGERYIVTRIIELSCGGIMNIDELESEPPAEFGAGAE